LKKEKTRKPIWCNANILSLENAKMKTVPMSQIPPFHFHCEVTVANLTDITVLHPVFLAIACLNPNKTNAVFASATKFRIRGIQATTRFSGK